MFREERRRRNAVRRKLARASVIRRDGRDAVAAIEGNDSDSDDEADGQVFMRQKEDDFGGMEFEIGGFEPASNAEGHRGQLGLPSLALSSMHDANTSRTYEDLCREHIKNFMRGAERWAQQSKLSSRVSAWQAQLEPLLQEQEARPEFNIRQYGIQIMDRLIVDDASEDKVDFADVVQGQDKFDVARMFLSTLQLANQGNVHIMEASDDGVGRATFKLRLLSLAPPQELGAARPSVAEDEEIDALLGEDDIEEDDAADTSADSAAAMPPPPPRPVAQKRVLDKKHKPAAKQKRFAGRQALSSKSRLSEETL